MKLYEPAVVYNCEPGGATGVALLLIALLALVPTEFVAVMVNVYGVPVVNPDTVIVPEPAWFNVPVKLPGKLVAV
jgi:hypothetical protein